jgi:hypothetical protein
VTGKQDQTSKDENKITRLIKDAISSAIDTVLAAKVQFMYQIYDIWLAWACGVVKGVMDFAQTLDWENCKLPVIDSGMRSLGGCACFDIPYSIPSAQKRGRWTEAAFWCSGLLMINEGDGNEKFIWNPFSLEELLAFPGARKEQTMNFIVNDIEEKMPLETDYQKYIFCMRRFNSACEYFKPQNSRL